MATYAKDTTVAVARSKEEIERILARYGASAFGYAWEGMRAVVNFKANGKFIRMFLPLPNPDADEFRYHTRSGRITYTLRTNEGRAKAHEQAQRQVWRALALIIKAKLEAVETGITTFDDEFMAHVVLPNGQTVAEFIQPQINEAYETGALPSLVPALPPGRDEQEGEYGNPNV